MFDGRETQNAVFRRCAYDLLEGLFSGTSGLLFAYGVTNSGKTYTMAGESYGDKPGILPRALDILFKGVGHGLVDRYVFKPDGKNGFYIQSPSEALRERERMPRSNPRKSTVQFPENHVVSCSVTIILD